MVKEMNSKESKSESRHDNNSSGVTGLILGIIAVISGVPGLLLGLMGFFFSLNQYKHSKNKWAVWGIVLNVIGFVLGVVSVVLIYYFALESQGLSPVANYGAN